MEYKEMDELLKSALSPTETPSEALNHRIITEMKEDQPMKWRNKRYLAAACIIAATLLLPVSIYAAQRLLSPKEISDKMDDNKLGEAFRKDGEEVYQSVTDGAYKATYLGHVTGESMSERTSSIAGDAASEKAAASWDLTPERTYVAVAIERSDGTEITYEDRLFVSPLIQGLKPWKYNIASMNGSYISQIIDGILYRIIECDSIEAFADRELYLIVLDTSFYSTDAYHCDETTGLITVNDDYPGTNILFPMKLDPSKADSEKANAYIELFEKEWNSGAEENPQELEPADEAAEDGEAAHQGDLYTDDENGITMHIEASGPTSSSNNYSSKGAFHCYFNVEGEGIESLTYTLNKGEFCYWPRVIDPDHPHKNEKEFYGNQYTIAYDEQDATAYPYTVSIYQEAVLSNYGYNEEYMENLKDTENYIETRSKIYRDSLNKELESAIITLEIKMKDGRVIEKELSFQVHPPKEEGFYQNIEVNVK